MTPLVIWLLLALAPGQAPAGLGVDELTRVRELYALASYEAALARLDRAGTSIDPGPAAQYRALCLLGLGRTHEVERVLEQLVLDVPAYAIPESEVPPRLAAMFRETRERALPAAARTRYTEAREAWDQQQLTQAIRGFRQVEMLLADDELVARVAGLRDLKMLSREFLALAEAAHARASAAPAAPPATAPPPATTAATAVEAAGAPGGIGAAVPGAPAEAAVPAPTAAVDQRPVYSQVDIDVVPPEEVSRRVPYWDRPGPLALQEFRGRLEVLVDEGGAVEAVTLVESVHPQFDGTLIEAANRWRFRPATRAGVPVRYRKTFDIVLSRR